MGLWAGLSEKPKIEPVILDFNRPYIDYSDIKGLNDEICQSVNAFTKTLEMCAERTRKQYELFVLSELYNRGYDLPRLENSYCRRYITPSLSDCGYEEFYVDGILVLTVKRTTRFADIQGKYLIYTDFEVED